MPRFAHVLTKHCINFEAVLSTLVFSFNFQPMPANGQRRSQSLDRCLAPSTKMQCLTTASKNWLRVKGRLLSGKERMRLQGIFMEKHKIALEETAEGALTLLSGNAINFFNMAQGLVAAFAALELNWFGPQNQP